MEIKHKLEKIFNNDYPGTDRFIADVIEPIFGNEIEYINDDLAERENYAEKAKNAGIKHIIYVGDLTEKNYNAENIALLDVTLDDSKNIERSRVNIQQLIRSIMDYRQHLMIVFHYEDVTNKQWRFSYAHKGDSLKDSTSAFFRTGSEDTADSLEVCLFRKAEIGERALTFEYAPLACSEIRSELCS